MFEHHSRKNAADPLAPILPNNRVSRALWPAPFWLCGLAARIPSTRRSAGEGQQGRRGPGRNADHMRRAARRGFPEALFELSAERSPSAPSTAEEPGAVVSLFFADNFFNSASSNNVSATASPWPPRLRR